MPLERVEHVKKVQSYKRYVNEAMTYVEPLRKTYFITGEAFKALTSLKTDHSIMQGRLKELRRTTKKQLLIENEYRMERRQIMAENEQLKAYIGKLENVLTQYRGYLSEEQSMRSKAEEENNSLLQKINTLMEKLMSFQREERRVCLKTSVQQLCDKGEQQHSMSDRSGSDMTKAALNDTKNYQHSQNAADVLQDVSQLKQMNSNERNELSDAKATIRHLQEIQKELMKESGMMRDEMEDMIFQYQGELSAQEQNIDQYQKTVGDLQRNNGKLNVEIDAPSKHQGDTEIAVKTMEAKPALENLQTSARMNVEIEEACEDTKNCSRQSPTCTVEDFNNTKGKLETEKGKGLAACSGSKQADFCQPSLIVVDEEKLEASVDCLQLQQDCERVINLEDYLPNSNLFLNDATETLYNIESISQQEERPADVIEKASQGTADAKAYLMTLDTHEKISIHEKIQCWLSEVDKFQDHYDVIPLDKDVASSDVLKELVLAKEEVQPTTVSVDGKDEILTNKDGSAVNENIHACIENFNEKDKIFEPEKVNENQKLSQPTCVPSTSSSRKLDALNGENRNMIRLEGREAQVNTLMNKLNVVEINAAIEVGGDSACIMKMDSRESNKGQREGMVNHDKEAQTDVAEEEQRCKIGLTSIICTKVGEIQQPDRGLEKSNNVKEPIAVENTTGANIADVCNNVASIAHEEQKGRDCEEMVRRSLDNARTYIRSLAVTRRKSLDKRENVHVPGNDSGRDKDNLICRDKGIGKSDVLEKVVLCENERKMKHTMISARSKAVSDAMIDCTALIEKKDLGKMQSRDIANSKANTDRNGLVIVEMQPFGTECSTKVTDVLALTRGNNDVNPFHINGEKCASSNSNCHIDIHDHDKIMVFHTEEGGVVDALVNELILSELKVAIDYSAVVARKKSESLNEAKTVSKGESQWSNIINEKLEKSGNKTHISGFTEITTADGIGRQKLPYDKNIGSPPMCSPEEHHLVKEKIAKIAAEKAGVIYDLEIEKDRVQEKDRKVIGESVKEEETNDDMNACRSEDEEFCSEDASDFEIESLPTDSECEPDDELDRFLSAKKNANKTKQPNTLVNHPRKQKSRYLFLDQKRGMVKRPLKGIKEDEEEMCDADELLEELDDLISI